MASLPITTDAPHVGEPRRAHQCHHNGETASSLKLPARNRRQREMMVLFLILVIWLFCTIKLSMLKSFLSLEKSGEIPGIKTHGGALSASWTVLLTVTDGFYDFFLNWLAYYKRFPPSHAIDAVVVIAEDDTVLGKLRRLQARDILPDGFRIERSRLDLGRPAPPRWRRWLNNTTNQKQENALSYDTSRYNSLVSTRAGRILALLDRGVDVLYTDVDTVWRSDPSLWVNSPRYSDKDFIAQSDGIRDGKTWYCTGFMALRSNARTTRLMKEWDAALKKPQLNQPVFNEIVPKATNQYRLRHDALPLDSFPHGEIYFGNGFANKRDKVVVVHNNYVIGHDVKKERFVRHGLWMLDSDGDLGDVDGNHPLVPVATPISEVKPVLLTIATTLHKVKPGTVKYFIQLNALKALTLLGEDVTVVVISDDTIAEKICQQVGIKHVVKEFKTNPHGTPYIRSIFEILDEHYSRNSTFLGYVNADILFGSGFIHTLKAIQAYVNGNLHRHLLVVGRRTNVMMDEYMQEDHTDMFPQQNLDGLDVLVNRLNRTGELMDTDAEDYFIITPGTFNWDNIPDLVIGRPGYDQWLVNYVYNRNDAHLIDATITVAAIHQTGTDGNKASFIERDDKEWNWEIGNGQYTNGFTNSGSLKTVWGNSTKDRVRVVQK